METEKALGRCDKAKYDKPVLRELIAESSKTIRLSRYNIEHRCEIKVVPRYPTSFGGRFFYGGEESVES